MLPESAKQKAREISYALIRVSFYAKRQALRDRLEGLSFELLESVSRLTIDDSRENMDKSLGIISALDGLVRLSHSIYEVEPVNATVLVRELDSLYEEIRKSGNQFGNGQELPHLAPTFTESEEEVLTAEHAGNETEENKKDIKNGVNLEDFSSAFNSTGNGNAVPLRGISQSGAINAAMRQSAIINKIKGGNGNGVRMKEIAAEFPDVSERTLRYDLQRLCGQGAIERVGNGGPASYYKMV